MTADLFITSNFTFLTGASHPEEYMRRAAVLGLEAIAIADENSVAGIARAHVVAREMARQVAERRTWEAREGAIGPPAPEPTVPEWVNVPRLIPAAKLCFQEGIALTALPLDRAGWGSLCRILSKGRLAAPKGECHLTLEDLEEDGENLHLLLHPPQAQHWPGGAGEWGELARRVTRRFGGEMHLLMTPTHDGADAARFDEMALLAGELGLPTLASAAPVMPRGRRRRL